MELLNKTLQQQQAAEHICSNTAYGLPMFFVPNPTTKQLNKLLSTFGINFMTKLNVYPLPLIDSIMSQVA